MFFKAFINKQLQIIINFMLKIKENSMGQVDRIIFEIEELRKKLNSLIINEKNKFTDARVVELSQELDMVLNRYNQLMRNSK